jgi:hypothetical protein
MSEGFAKLKARSRLPDPPADESRNLSAPETAPAIDEAEVRVEPSRPSSQVLISPAQTKPRIDGRMRLRKDRTEALSTKIKPRHRELLMELADAYGGTLSETLERAIEALEQQAKREGKHLS